MKVTEELFKYLLSENSSIHKVIEDLNYIISRKPDCKSKKYAKIKKILENISDESIKTLSHKLFKYNLQTDIIFILLNSLACLIIYCKLLKNITASV